MPEYVRVKDNETTHEYSVTAERYAADPSLYTKLDRPAADAAGIPFPPKYRTTVAQRAAENKATSQASTTTASVESGEKAASPAIEKEK